MTTYFLYARKSQDRDDRQVASIDDQITEMTLIAKRKGLKIVEIFKESRSAKSKGRPVFNDMMERIRKGEANGILCWKLNRLARNPYDGGEITGLLQESVITEIQTSQKSYYPHDNVITIMVEFGMATQYSKDLSYDVQRGLRRKALERKWYPLPVLPAGYKHNPLRAERPEEDEIIPDPERFQKIKELWNLLGTGAYSIREIYDHADTLGLTNSKGKSYSYSSFHRIFQNPFYCGYFYWRDEMGKPIRVNGKHTPMLTESQFEQVQQHLEQYKRETRNQSYEFSYRGILSCGECGGYVTADRVRRATCSECKKRFSTRNSDECPRCHTRLDQMNNPSQLDITYYRCTKKKDKSCSQGSLSESAIESRFMEDLREIEISENFYHFAKKKLASDDFSCVSDSEILNAMRQKQTKLEKKKRAYVEMRAEGELSSEEYITMKELIDTELKELNREILFKETKEENLKEKANTYLDLALNCTERFKTASTQVKKGMIEAFGSNHQLLDKTLIYQRKKPLEAIFGVNMKLS